MGQMTDIINETIFKEIETTVTQFTGDVWGNITHLTQWINNNFSLLFYDVDNMADDYEEAIAITTLYLEHLIFDEIYGEWMDKVDSDLNTMLIYEGNFWRFLQTTLGFYADSIRGPYYLYADGFISTTGSRLTLIEDTLDLEITPGLAAVNKRIDELELDAIDIEPEILLDIQRRLVILEDQIGVLTPSLIADIEFVAANIEDISGLLDDIVGDVTELVFDELEEVVSDYVDPLLQIIDIEIKHLQENVAALDSVMFGAVIDAISFLLTGLRIPSETVTDAIDAILVHLDEVIEEAIVEIWKHINFIEKMAIPGIEADIAAIKKKLLM